MRYTVITVLVALVIMPLVSEAASKRPPQFPRPPQYPVDVDNKVSELCPCSLTGTCQCSLGNDCGCISKGSYRWVSTANPNQTALYIGDKQLGNYWHSEKVYKRLDSSGEKDMWVVTSCPVNPPVNVVTAPNMFPTTTPFNGITTRTNQSQFYFSPGNYSGGGSCSTCR